MNENPVNESSIIDDLTRQINELKKQNSELSKSGFELISAQTKLQSLLHNASDGIISFSGEGLVETVNTAAQHIFGYSEGEIVNRKIPNLIPCPDWAAGNVGAYINYFIKSRASSDIPLKGMHKMGFDILLQVSTGQASTEDTMLFDEENVLTDPFADDMGSDSLEKDSIVCFFKDITLNKKLEKELAEQKYALDLAAGVIMRDKDFRVFDVNNRFCHILGRNRNEFIGEKYLQSKFADKAINEIRSKKIRAFLSQGNPWVGESCFTTKKDEKVWFTESITPFLDENKVPYQYLSILFDITDRKKYHQQLEQHRDNLQELVDAQVNDIRIARDKAELADKSKTEFLANMSHELRTPMHGIISFTQLSLKQFKNLPLNEERTNKLMKFISNIETSSQRLLSLLNDLLDLSKLESGKEEYKLEFHDIHHLIQQIHDEYSAKIIEKNINFIIHKPRKLKTIKCDKNKILQVLSNLTSNAIKFSANNTTVSIKIQNTQVILGKRATDTEKTDGVLLSITDQGPGIPDDELSNIFNKFIQSSQTKSGAGGTGLGLSICQEITLAHNGKLWAEHSSEGGAIFKLFLPDYNH